MKNPTPTANKVSIKGTKMSAAHAKTKAKLVIANAQATATAHTKRSTTVASTKGAVMRNAPATPSKSIQSKGAHMATKAATPAKTNGKTPPKPPKAAGEKPTPKYVLQQSKRQRFSFGPVWENAVMAGTVKDKAKLVAHGVKLEVGNQKELSALDMPALLAKVQEGIKHEKKSEKKSEK